MSVERLGSSGAAGARRRHPSARGAGTHLVAPMARVAAVGAPVAGPHRDVASAVLAVRGADGRSRAAFAAAYGLGAHEVAAMEAGRVPLAELPAPLSILTPVVAVARALGPRVA